MKTLIATTALVLTAFSASAMSDSDISAIQKLVPNADLSTLTNAEVAMLISVINGDQTNSMKRAMIEVCGKVIRDGIIPMPPSLA